MMRDPVVERRALIAKWTEIAQRSGYLLFAIAVVLFFVALFTGFEGVIVTLIVICLIVGSLVLAPAIVLGYAVKAATRADDENDW